MAINFETTTPNKLIADFKKAIDDKHIVTWAYDKDGDFYHTPDQWREAGWLRPTVYEGQRVTMNFLGRTGRKTSKADYGVYHGRFIESMLTHCDKLFTNAIASALPTNRDQIAA